MAKRKKTKVDWDAWESQARRRSAWGEYVQTINHQKACKEENELKKAKRDGDTEKVKEIEKKRDNRTPMLYIG